MTKVKVGNVTNLSEARYCAGMGVDFLSFPISQIDPKMYQEITAWVTGPKFGIEAELEGPELIAQYHFDFIQTRDARSSGLKIGNELFMAVPIGEWPNKKDILLHSKDSIRYIELEFLSLDAPTVKLVEEISRDFQVFLKPTGTVDVAAVLKMPIAGISLEGSSEAKPGLKEYPLSKTLEMLEAVD